MIGPAQPAVLDLNQAVTLHLVHAGRRAISTPSPDPTDTLHFLRDDVLRLKDKSSRE
jgi:hypothetical protein